MTSVEAGIVDRTARQQCSVIAAVSNVGMTTESSGTGAYVIACDDRLLLFVLQHAAALALLLVTAAAAGTAVAGTRASLALRSTLGLAVAGQAFVVLGTLGALRPWTIGACVAIALIAGAARLQRSVVRWRSIAVATLVTLPLFVLALYPPLAFDETLYHLPFVRAMADSGAIRFEPDLRFPAFPKLHEVLCVPGFLALGDVSTHLVALAELLLLAALLIEWPRQRHAGFLVAALLLGNPIVIYLATITYVEMAMTLFITAGFYCLDRATSESGKFYLAAAGFLFGTACSVKYLGWYFALAAFAFVLLFASNRRRTIPIFGLTFIAAVLPMYGSIVALTGNPVFPFLPALFGFTPWTHALPCSGVSAVRVARLFWDITFAREHVNLQPPYSPLFPLALLITILAARRNRRAAFLAAVCAGYIAIFFFLPRDSRYLLPLLPLVSVMAVSAVAAWKRLATALSLVSIALGFAYAGYHLARLGPLPMDGAQRRQFLERHIPEYRALQRRGPGRVYVCGAEQLKYFGGADLLGEVVGPQSNERILGCDAGDLAGILARLDVRYLLVSRRACAPEWQRLPSAPEFERVYADAGAELWRVSVPLAVDSR